MAEAFIKGLLNGGFPAADIHFFEPNEKRRAQVVERYGISCAEDNETLVGISNIVVLATKPQILDKVLQQVNGAFNDDKLLISILAGITTTTLEAGLGGQARVVRAMPNTPALAGRGAAALCSGMNTTEEDRRVAQHLFESVGIALWVEEGQMDAVTGLSGSGPAYVYTFIESLTAGGVQEGLRLDIAHALAVQTVVGAAHLVQVTGEHPALLREKVCSPAGTTISAIRVLEERGLRASMMEAVGAATKRSRQLGEENK
jgi:pyrroline-5-carboxylate reductase